MAGVKRQMKNMKPSVLALIPARSGSKSIPDKNIRKINRKPMLAYSIGHALLSKYIDRVVVSTDSEKYARIAESYGAEVPFLRPPEISGDLSTDLEVFQHALNFFIQSEKWCPDICVHLRPTYPIRPDGLIDEMIEKLIHHPDACSIRTVTRAAQTPFKMWYFSESGLINPVIQNPDYPEAWNMPRQSLPQVFIQNACVDVVRTRIILENHSMTGLRIMGFPMEDMFDIDLPSELKQVQKIMRIK